MVEPALSRALAAYVTGQGSRGHVDRGGDPAGLSVPEYAREVAAARAEEVARWDAWWGDRLSGRPRRILDAGCGPGFCARALGEHFGADEVVGLDIEPAAIAVVDALARDYPRLSGHVGRIEDLDLGHFDLIVSRTVLEHVYHPRRALERLIGALSPGGALFLETPNYLFPYEPHVGLVMLPKSPKALLRAQCRLSGRDAAFVGHLQFACDPVTLGRWATEAGADVHNLAADKVRRILEGREVPSSTLGRRISALANRSPAVVRRALSSAAGLPFTPSVQLLITRS